MRLVSLCFFYYVACPTKTKGLSRRGRRTPAGEVSASSYVLRKLRENTAVPLAPPPGSSSHPLLARRSLDVRGAPERRKGRAAGGNVLGGSGRCASRGWNDCGPAPPKAVADTFQVHGTERSRWRVPLQGLARGARASKSLHRRKHWPSLPKVLETC